MGGSARVSPAAVVESHNACSLQTAWAWLQMEGPFRNSKRGEERMRQSSLKATQQKEMGKRNYSARGKGNEGTMWHLKNVFDKVCLLLRPFEGPLETQPTSFKIVTLHPVDPSPSTPPFLNTPGAI